MSWPIEVILFSIILLFIWTALFRWSSKRIAFARYFIIGNFIIYLFYTLALFRPLFIEDLGRGGGAFSAGMMIIIIAPLHLALAYISVLLFSRTDKEGKLTKILRNVGLPAVAIVVGYLISEKQNSIAELKNQGYFEELKRQDEIEKRENSKTHQEFKIFLSNFTADSVYQLEHINLPVPVFYINDSLEIDSVIHYYKHQWPYHLLGLENDVEIYNDWEFNNRKSDEKVIRLSQENKQTEYYFKVVDGQWQLREIKKIN